MNENQIIEAIRSCARSEEPALDISNILKSHGCYSLLKAKNTPSELLERVVNTSALKERYRACEPFFKNAQFPYAVIKGAVLSLTVCGEATRRVSGDIDILINRRDADRAKKLLQNCGFVQGRVTEEGIVPFSRKEILYQTATTHQTAPYVKKTDNPLCPYVNVDINMDILWGESEKRSDMDEVLCYKEKLTLFDVDIYKLTPEMEFIQLCLHHYKDMNSIYLLYQKGLQLGLFCDIYFYIRNARPSVTATFDIAKRLNVGRFVYVCLDHTMSVFSDDSITPYLEAFQCEKDEDLLESFGLCDNERKLWDIPLLRRIFHPNLSNHLLTLLSEKDMEKIHINLKNM